MEYSQTFHRIYNTFVELCLNPYSNGILTDRRLVEYRWRSHVLILILMEYSQTIYQRAGYIFFRSSFHTVLSLSAKKLVRLERFFRKCRDLKDTFQIKTMLFSNIHLDINDLLFRKTKRRLNCLRDLRKRRKEGFASAWLWIHNFIERRHDGDAFSQM